MSKFNFKLVASIFVLGLSGCGVSSDMSKISKDEIIMSLAASEWDAGIKNQYIRFSDKGKLNGNGGCNRFFANYTQEGNTLNIGSIGSTKMMCANMKEENKFFDVLRATQKIEASHLVLVLKAADGKTLLTLKRRDWG
ncbi:MAG: hypothetical protein COA43_04280 [Robiginitomaculum sp.]|nr:MAG: hypothetical protein COA43_04280 [Robiginitomaculum sp.]